MITDIYNQALAGDSLKHATDQEIFQCADYYLNDTKYIFTNNVAEMIKNPGKYAAERRILQEASKRIKPGEDNPYANVAREKFTVIINELPRGMQGLIFLNDIGEFEKVVAYCKKIPPKQEYQSWFNTPQSKEILRELKEKLTQDVYVATKKLALRELWETPGFKDLPKDVREQLIEQQAYVTRLQYDLEFTDTITGKEATDKLEKYSSALKNNIKDAMSHYKTLGDKGQKEFDSIKENITAVEKQIRQQVLKQQTVGDTAPTTLAKLAAGLGGIAWLTGFGIPAVAAAFAAKGGYESYSARTKIPVIEKELNESENLLKSDFVFIKNLDATFQIGTNAPIDSINVQTQSLFADVKETAMATLMEQTKDYVEEGEKRLNAINNKANEAADTGIWAYRVMLRIGIGTLVLVSIGVIVAFPPIWPAVIVINLIVGASLAVLHNKINKAQPKLITEQAIPNKKFNETIAWLNNASPGLWGKLEDHYNSRIQSIERSMQPSEKSPSAEDIEKISESLKELNAQWLSLKSVADNPKLFSNAIEQYLRGTYIIERDKYVELAKKRKDYDLSKEKQTLVFNNADFKMLYDNEKQELLKLKGLKENVAGIKDIPWVPQETKSLKS